MKGRGGLSLSLSYQGIKISPPHGADVARTLTNVGTFLFHPSLQSIVFPIFYKPFPCIHYYSLPRRGTAVLGCDSINIRSR